MSTEYLRFEGHDLYNLVPKSVLRSSRVYCVLAHSKKGVDARILGTYSTREGAVTARERAQKQYKGQYIAVVEQTLKGQYYLDIVNGDE